MSADLPAYSDYEEAEDRYLPGQPLPAHWKHLALKRMLRFGNGKDHKNVEVDDGGYPVYGSGGPFALASEYLHDGESVLFGRKGTVDRPLYLNCRFWTVDTMYFTRIDSRVCARFIYYAALGIPYSLYSTNTALPSMPQEVLGNHKIPAPPLQEQARIAKFLDYETAKIDALIEKQQQLIALLKEKRQAVISHAVTKGLNPDAPVRDSEVEWLGEVPAHWTVCKIKQVAELESGHTPSRKVDEYWQDCQIPWVSLNDTSQLKVVDYISETTVCINEKGMANSSAHELPGGCVVFTRDASIGLAAITARVMAVSQHIIAWVCDPMKVTSEYLLLVFYAMEAELERFTFGATLKTIGMPDVKRLTGSFPPLEEQARIVEHVFSAREALSASIRKSEEMLEILAERRTALISAAVTGKIDVRGWKAPDSEPEAEVA